MTTLDNPPQTFDSVDVEPTQEASFVRPKPNRLMYMANKKLELKYLIASIIAVVLIDQAAHYTIKRFEKVNNVNYPWWNNHTEGMNPQFYGQWSAVIPDLDLSASRGENLGIQTVHSAVLPSGKILFASGSSWRNFKSKTQLFPDVKEPKSAVGLYDHEYFKLTGNKTKDDAKLYEYFSLNNNIGIYDPIDNTFYRIPHPPTIVYNTTFEANDFFCIGHNHLPDGNVLFAGGTEYYYPYRSGAKTSYVFNWTKQEEIDWTKLKNWNFNSWDEVLQNAQSKQFYPWIYTGLMRDGRWYPSILPLTDHKLVVVGGYRGNFTEPVMYKYEMNKFVDIFDFDKFKKDPLSAWNSIDVSEIKYSPFTTKLDHIPPAGNCSSPIPDGMDTTTFQRYCKNYQYDAFKLYPQNYLIKQNQIYITQEGDWNSLRQTFSCCIRLTKRTYYMNLLRDSQNNINNISFEGSDGKLGPQFYRLGYVTMSGTSVQYSDFYKDNKKKILLYGGMALTTGGTMIPGLVSIDNLAEKQDYDSNLGVQYAGSRGSRKMQRFDMDEKLWKVINQTYLGATYSDDRTMHYAILLPTKQILIINGGNYDYFGPVMAPLLLTPISSSEQIQFNRTYLAPSRYGKLYHNVALLLRDGSIMTSGGNAARAMVDNQQPMLKTTDTKGQYKFNRDRVQVNIFFRNDSTYSIGHNLSPAESMYAEIFKPPYMFIGEKNRTMSVEIMNAEQKTTFGKKNQAYYLIKSNKEYVLKVESNLKFFDFGKCEKENIALMKLSSSTHGWNSGQSLLSLSYRLQTDQRSSQVNQFVFTTPDAKQQLLPPGFYHIFYVDCLGKPARSVMVRFDDLSDSIF